MWYSFTFLSNFGLRLIWSILAPVAGVKRKRERPAGGRGDSSFLLRIFYLTYPFPVYANNPAPAKQVLDASFAAKTCTHCVPVQCIFHRPCPTHTVFAVNPNMGQDLSRDFCNLFQPEFTTVARREENG